MKYPIKVPFSLFEKFYFEVSGGYHKPFFIFLFIYTFFYIFGVYNYVVFMFSLLGKREKERKKCVHCIVVDER